MFISLTDFIGEVILIYRCWLLWSKNYWIIILPSLTAIAGLGKVLSDQSLEPMPTDPLQFSLQYALPRFFIFYRTPTRLRQ